jgi:GntR family transcriptional regulator/MocR family aminotransferase
MRIPIERDGERSLWQQIEMHLRQSILTGNLAPGTRLPASRELAKDLNISRTTVENAYATLEADGLVMRHVGRGTYVLDPGTRIPPLGGRSQEGWPRWQQDLLPTARHLAHETIASSARRHPAPIALTGFGDPRRFPVKDFYRAIKEVMDRDGTAALDLGDLRGYAPLRATTAHILASQGLSVSPDSVLITSGSQQALALVIQILLSRGDTVLVESPTYDLALEFFRIYGLKVVSCPTDAWGMQVESLESVLQQQQPKLIYTMPNFQNPTGVSLSLARRHELLALSERYNIPILEDDFVGDLRYEGSAFPALKALDSNGQVIHMGTFSKMLMPGLRVGFLIADGPMYNRLVELKRVSDLATSSLIQRSLEAYITVGRYQAHLRRSCQVYRRRRDAMLNALDRSLPGARVIPPHGGLFMWVTLPEAISSRALLPFAIAEGVDYAPGGRFFTDRAEGEGYLRLNFATQTPENIEEGVRRLGTAIQHYRLLK